MAKSMTPSRESKTTTAGQIDKFLNNCRVWLEKHGKEFESVAVQTVLGQPEFADAVVQEFRRRVEVQSNLIIRRVPINRSLTPQEVLDATGRRQYTDSEVVDSMPRGTGEEAGVFFFHLGRYVSDDELEKEFDLRGLVPAFPDDLAAVNAADPNFAKEKPNGTHWKGEDGKWRFIAFNHWNDERNVNVYCNDNDWNDSWWFAGRRK